MNALDLLQTQLAAFRAQGVVADACAGAVIDTWTALVADAAADDMPTAERRFAATAATAEAQAQLRTLAEALGELGCAFDTMLCAATGERTN